MAHTTGESRFANFLRATKSTKRMGQKHRNGHNSGKPRALSARPSSGGAGGRTTPAARSRVCPRVGSAPVLSHFVPCCLRPLSGGCRPICRKRTKRTPGMPPPTYRLSPRHAGTAPPLWKAPCSHTQEPCSPAAPSTAELDMSESGRGQGMVDEEGGNVDPSLRGTAPGATGYCSGPRTRPT